MWVCEYHLICQPKQSLSSLICYSYHSYAMLCKVSRNIIYFLDAPSSWCDLCKSQDMTLRVKTTGFNYGNNKKRIGRTVMLIKAVESSKKSAWIIKMQLSFAMSLYILSANPDLFSFSLFLHNTQFHKELLRNNTRCCNRSDLTGKFVCYSLNFWQQQNLTASLTEISFRSISNK